MAMAVPGCQGMFTIMQHALKNTTNCITLSRGIHDTLEDLRWLSDDLATRPTCLYELIPQDQPEITGTTDTSGYAMAGVLLLLLSAMEWRSDGDNDMTPLAHGSTPLVPQCTPILWQANFPLDIIRWLVTPDNPAGDIPIATLPRITTMSENAPQPMGQTIQMLLHGNAKDQPVAPVLQPTCSNCRLFTNAITDTTPATTTCQAR